LYDGFPRISAPRTRTEPLARGGVIPMIAAQSVVFPIPFRPTIAIGSSPIVKETPCRTCAGP
jgi:hypothetical protein